MKKGKKRGPKSTKKKTNQGKGFSLPLRLKVVKLYTEEQYPTDIICRETGASYSSLQRWVKLYRMHGEAGLERGYSSGKRQKLHPEIKSKIIDLKRMDKSRGTRRISDILKRFFFLKASPEAVRKTLNQENLIEPPRKKRQHNRAKPRFFERSKPNQLWQSDICMYKIKDKFTYLIGYIDDYSRYITGLEIFTSQTAGNVIEVYRKAAVEYGPPKEMLTDNGRQYTTWRGTTRFEQELRKDKIHHIKSQPHHPMTLGKIERFWKSIMEEFLNRTTFDTFDEARERLRLWVKYYNHRRPHQGIGSLCPADRFFEISSQIRQTMDKGIQENILELALRGKPAAPFYMVGRMQGQDVVLRAEKGKLRLSVDDDVKKNSQELIYDLNSEGGKDNGENQEKIRTAYIPAQCAGEGTGSVKHLDGTAEACTGLQGDGDTMGDAEPLAEPCTGGHDAGPGAEDQTGAGSSTESPPASISGEEATELSTTTGTCSEVGEPANKDTGAESASTGEGHQDKQEHKEEVIIPEERSVLEPTTESGRCPGHEACHYCNAGTERPDISDRRCPAIRSIPQDILRVGAEGPDGHDEGSCQQPERPPTETGGYREGPLEEEHPGAGGPSGDSQEVRSCQEHPGCHGREREELVKAEE